ncbi:MAG: hypothetical protein IJ604_01490 [Prevotella sp.]|nr:hypothetical protein [Prevotella sp.]MBR1462039.1 hypothetical protein [Prevotella sp.]
MKTIAFKFNTLSIILLLVMGFAGCGDEEIDTIDDFQIYFTVSNTNGDNSGVYSSQDEIFFTLAVYTSENLRITKTFENSDITVDEDFFSIHTENGKLFMKPSMDKLSFAVNETTKGPYVFRYKWEPYTVPSGKYYTRFAIKYNDSSEKGIIKKKELFAKFEIR